MPKVRARVNSGRSALPFPRVPSRRVEARAGNGEALGISRRSWSTDVVAVRPTSTERSVEPLSRITMAERTSGK